MSVQIRRFAAPWSAATWLVTLIVIAVTIIVAGVLLTQAENVSSDNQTSRMTLIAAAMIAPLILLVAVLYAPLGYTVDDVGIVVNRMGPKVCIIYSEITAIQQIRRRDLGFSIRVGGSGGFLGFYGRFWSKRLGHHRAYVTNGRDLVLIERVDGTKVVLSPYPADVFVAAVEAARGGSA